jgi:hypothetical protein
MIRFDAQYGAPADCRAGTFDRSSDKTFEYDPREPQRKVDGERAFGKNPQPS